MKIKRAIFTGAFTGITLFLSVIFIPETHYNNIIFPVIAGLSAYVGGLIGLKLFQIPKKGGRLSENK